MKNIILTMAMLVLIAGCKKSDTSLSLIGSTMTVTRNGTTAQFEQVNIFTPNGDGKNDIFWGPITYCQTDSNDRVTGYTLKIIGTDINISNSPWDGYNNGQPLPEGIYSYEVDYTTYNGSATVTGLVRLWKSSTVLCAEKPLYLFPQAYNSLCEYDSLSPYNENIPCH